MSDTENRRGGGARLMGDIQFGARNNGLDRTNMGAVMGFMGLPFLTRQWAGKGSSGPWMTVDPRRRTVSMGGGGFGGGGWGSGNPGTGGEDPGTGGDGDGTDSNDLPGDKYGKNLIPEWWKQWYRTYGQFGTAPNVQGLL